MYNVIIIGAGVSGMSAGIYAAANNLKTLVIAKEILPPKQSGFELVDYNSVYRQFQKFLKENKKFLELKNKTEVLNIEKNIVSFTVEIKTGQIFYCRTIIIATGKNSQIFDLLTYKAGAGGIKVNNKMQTNIPGIFVVGEANDAGRKNLLASAGEGAKERLKQRNI